MWITCAALRRIALAAVVVMSATARPAIAEPLSVTSFSIMRRSSDEAGSRNRRTPLIRTLTRVALGSTKGGEAATAYLTSFTLANRVTDRPVIFAFNGGPGASSVILQLGLLGPRLIQLPEKPDDSPAVSFKLAENPDSLFDKADIVFVDPVGTGFGRLLSAKRSDAVWSTAGDAAYVASIIRSWTRKERRWNSPVYLLGESYGAKRAVDVAYDLACIGRDATCIRSRIDGIVLLSQSIAMVDTTQRPGNVQGIAMGLPTLAALAWYHHKVPQPAPPLKVWVEQAEEFARTRYISALFQGSDLPSDELEKTEERLAYFTGLPVQYFRTNGIAITKDAFRFQLFAAEGQVLSVADGRFTTPKALWGGQADRFTELADAAFAWGAERVYGTLGNAKYRVLDDGIEKRWVYGNHLSYSSNYPFAQHLGALLTNDPKFRTLIAGGYFDTMASYGGDSFVRRHLDGARHDQVEEVHYAGGHMFYTDPESRRLFAEALRTFVR